MNDSHAQTLTAHNLIAGEPFLLEASSLLPAPRNVGGGIE